MKKLTKKQIGIIAIVAVVVIAIIGCVIGFSLSKNKEEKEPTIELTDDKVTEVDMEDILESTEDYVVVNIDALKDLVGLKFVSGDDTTFTVTVDGKELVFTVGSTSYTIDGENKEMKTPAVKNGNVYGIEVETVVNDLGHNVTVSRIEGKVTDVIITRNENVANENKDEDKTNTTEKDTQSGVADDTQTNTEEQVVTKTTMYAKSNVNVRSGAGTSNSQIGSLTKGQEVVKIGEENGWSKIEFNGGIGYVKSEYLSTEKVDTNTQSNQNTNNSGNNNSSTNNGTTNNTTSNNNQGNTSGNTGGSATGGMYTPGGDSISFERMNKCASILDGGMASSFVPVDRGQSHVAYWDGTIWISASNTDGAWVYVKLAGWYADTTNVGSDETRPGYAEIPSLVKQCLETIAPEGGTELYNKVSALVSQYGSDYQVPTQGRISESIPGLYVTLEKGKNGLEISFWAE